MGKETVVMSLGGSLIVPKQIDINFLSEFRRVVETHTQQYRFHIVAGGGRTARNYIQAARVLVPNLSTEEADNLGIRSGLLNSQFLLTLFGNKAYPKLVTDYNSRDHLSHDIAINGFYKPGGSSDLIAVETAEAMGVKRVINLTDTNGVYDKDPKSFRDAVRYEELSWERYCEMFNGEWKAGSHSPFDVIASRKAKSIGLEVVVANGRDLQNLGKIIRREAFEGTTIRS